MLQTSTTDIDINLLPNGMVSKTPVSALSPDENAFYNSIKEELNAIASNPSAATVTTILNYSKLL
ncbi:MAG: hypothetical protein H7Y07_17570 [Pyrinomonadaceae bacterium]|nr:hypothetical protein [Sphingobacteriaceae bacterium]